MNILKTIRVFFATSFLILSVHAIDYSGQNILVSRAPAKDLYFKEMGWYAIKRKADDQELFSSYGSFQITPFYQKTLDTKKLSNYFGVNNKTQVSYSWDSELDTSSMIHNAIYDGYTSTFTRTVNIVDTNNAVIYAGPVKYSYRYNKQTNPSSRGTYTLTTDPSFTANPSLQQAILNNSPYYYLGFDPNNETVITALVESFSNETKNNSLTGNLSLAAARKVLGCLLSYHVQTIDSWWISLDLPILHVKQKMIPIVEDESKFTDPRTGRVVSMKELLSGQYDFEKNANAQFDNPSLQKALRYSKFRLDEFKKTGIGDLDLSFGVKVCDQPDFDCDIFSVISFPTADKIDPEFVFAPQLGANGHFSFGLGCLFSLDLYSSSDSSFAITAGMLSKYSFPKTQLRTLNYLSDRGVALPWSKYTVVAEIGVAGPVLPFANISTVDVKVSPGLFGETFFALNCDFNYVLIDTGASLFFSQGESLKLQEWGNAGKYGPPSVRRYRTDQVYNPARYPFGELDGSAINLSEIALEKSSTPGSVSWLLFLQASYQAKINVNKVIFSAGMSYESSLENVVMSNLTVWLKAGIAF